MGIDVELTSEVLILRLTRWDRVANFRRRLIIDVDEIKSIRVVERSDLEKVVDHRVLGIGTHDGERRPNRRRVGTMLGRDVVGKQFWAVPAGADTQLLVVIDLSADSDLKRVVVGLGDPEGLTSAIRRRICHP